MDVLLLSLANFSSQFSFLLIQGEHKRDYYICRFYRILGRGTIIFVGFTEFWGVMSANQMLNLET
jgi:hypothetical protein